jgi:hypothetical protein
MSTSSTSWATSVIALSYTLSTYHHSILLLILLLTTLSFELVFFFFLSQKVFFKVFIFFLFIYDTLMRKVILTLFNAGISFVKQQKSKCLGKTTSKVILYIQQTPSPTTTFLATVQEDLKHLIDLCTFNPF